MANNVIRINHAEEFHFMYIHINLNLHLKIYSHSILFLILASEIKTTLGELIAELSVLLTI